MARRGGEAWELSATKQPLRTRSADDELLLLAIYRRGRCEAVGGLVGSSALRCDSL